MKTLSSKGFISRFLLISILFLMMYASGNAQPPSLSDKVTIVHAEDFPNDPVNLTWLENTRTREIYVYHDGEWKHVLSGEFSEMYACQRWVVLRKADSLFVSTMSASTIFKDCKGVYCSASIFGFWGSFLLQFDDGHFNTLSNIYGLSKCSNWQVKELQVQGQSAFCLPRFFIGNVYYTCDQLHCWGILGGSGEWLIEPKYDGPFEFVGGIAEVMEKGRRFRINEKGEIIQ